jgi:glycerophosphoryl diester phosphodiesterase
VPANAAYPFLDWPGTLPFAHRGGASEVPENTMPAFEHAVRLGYRYLETDAHVTADGVLIAFHDDRLDRVTDRTGVIAELPWSEVQQARVDGREPIPLLEDLLTAWPDVRINIDPKQDDVAEPLAAALLRTDTVDRVCVGAFSDRRIARVRELTGPGLCTSMGPREVAQLVSASRSLPGGGRISSPCAQVPTHQGRLPLVTERFVAAAHRRGVQVHVWTVDDPAEITRLLDLGVDGIMTDRPQVLKDLLVDRGDWHQ